MKENEIINVLEIMCSEEKAKAKRENDESSKSNVHVNRVIALQDAIFLYKNKDDYFVDRNILKNIRKELDAKLEAKDTKITKAKKHELEVELKLINKLLEKEGNKKEETFVNSFGEATKREITNTTYKKSQKRLERQIMSFIK